MIGSLVPCMYWQSNPFIDHLKVMGDPNQRSKRAGSYGLADTVSPILPNPAFQNLKQGSARAFPSGPGDWGRGALQRADDRPHQPLSQGRRPPRGRDGPLPLLLHPAGTDTRFDVGQWHVAILVFLL